MKMSFFLTFHTSFVPVSSIAVLSGITEFTLPSAKRR
jgi:hypothetical protein